MLFVRHSGYKDSGTSQRVNADSSLTKITFRERRHMAGPNFNSRERAEIYRLLFLLNRSFYLIAQRLEELGKTGVINALNLRDMRGMTQEMQLDINVTALDILEMAEANDLGHFGKVRKAMEKRLRTPL